jgi:hypothetical protein
MVERSDRNPNCSGGRRLLISRKFFRRVERIFSKTFPAMFRRIMGRHERGLVGSFPGLGIMTVVACFQARGKWWARMQLLKITVRATMTIRGRFLNMGALSSSGPVAFLLFNSSTSSGRTSTTRESSSGRRRRGWFPPTNPPCDGSC